MHIITSLHVIKFVEIYRAKLIDKNLCNFLLKEAYKLGSEKFGFIEDLTSEFIFIQSSIN